MFEKFKKLFSATAEEEAGAGSVEITDQSILRRFLDNPDFARLISFPRTGSHWLRLLMELYFEKPSLVRAFYFKEATDFTCYHAHDFDLDLRAKNVIYLYRHPVPTVYSQLKYDQASIDDIERITFFARLYGQHLKKWLVTDNFTERKTVLTYEGLSANPASEFAKICAHLGLPFDREKFDLAAGRVSKKSLKVKTTHDSQVVNLSPDYEKQREAFQRAHSALVMETVFAQEAKLQALFAPQS